MRSPEKIKERPVTEMTILDALGDPALLGQHFEPRESWTAWRAFLAALFGLPLAPNEFEVFRRCTGRTDAPTASAREGWVIAGRRGGKSRVAALVAVYLAAFRSYAEILAPGERGTVMVLATDRRQARTIMRYITGILESVPMIAALVERQGRESVSLTNRVVIEVHTANYRSIRGYTVLTAICDEIAFWRDEDSANPDREIISALRPAMATVPGALLLAISSPYARRGLLWTMYEKHYAREESPCLIWRAGTRTMNPTVPQHIISEAEEADPAAAAAEWHGEFRKDIETFISVEAIDAVIDRGVLERPPEKDRDYFAFCDPSGGASDSMTFAIASTPCRREGRNSPLATLDLLREVRPPFSPEAVVGEFASLAKLYRVQIIKGDRYGAGFVEELFRRQGVGYEPAPAKNEIYRSALAIINSQSCRLLDNERMRKQLLALERKALRNGDVIDHAPGGHDDLANAAAGAIVTALIGVPQAVFGLAAVIYGRGQLVEEEGFDPHCD